jgi:hypothetical protein
MRAGGSDRVCCLLIVRLWRRAGLVFAAMFLRDDDRMPVAGAPDVSGDAGKKIPTSGKFGYHYAL